MSSVGRNEKCPCGSQKKYKKCCGIREREALAQQVMPQRVEVGMMISDGDSQNFAFPPLPAGIKNPRKLCEKWAKKEFESRSMEWELDMSDETPGNAEPVFTVFAGEDDHASGAGFYEQMKRSFMKAVNDELKRSGASGSYSFI